MAVAGAFASALQAGKDNANVGFGELYYEDEVVRTVVPPAAMKKEGTDPLYAVMGGVEGQLPVIGNAPGDKAYRGGKWAFHTAVWEDGETPELITSETQLLGLELAGKIVVTRVRENDFKCPVQP